MARRKEPRGLNAEERALWQKVTRGTQPLHRNPPAAPAPPDRPDRPPAPAKPALAPFRIGADPAAPGHDLSPPLAERLAGQPVRMDKRAFGRLRRGKLKPEARLDLHGMTLAEAHPALTGFILRAAAQGKRLVLVITGKGKRSPDDGPIPARPGLLRHQVPHWLATPPLAALILQVTPAHASHGGGGAYYVYLRRPR